MPDTMTAMTVSEPGGPDVPKSAKIAVPAPGAGEAPIRPNRWTITGSRPRPRSVEEKGRLRMQARKKMCQPLLAKGAARAEIREAFPLTRAGHAHRPVATSDHIGKILLVP